MEIEIKTRYKYRLFIRNKKWDYRKKKRRIGLNDFNKINSLK